MAQWEGFISELPAVMSTTAARLHSLPLWCSPAEPLPSAYSSSCLQEVHTEGNTATATLANSLSQQTHASSSPSSQTSSGLIFVLLPCSGVLKVDLSTRAAFQNGWGSILAQNFPPRESVVDLQRLLNTKKSFFFKDLPKHHCIISPRCGSKSEDSPASASCRHLGIRCFSQGFTWHSVQDLPARLSFLVWWPEGQPF